MGGVSFYYIAVDLLLIAIPVAIVYAVWRLAKRSK